MNATSTPKSIVPEGWGSMSILDRLRAVGADPIHYAQVRSAYAIQEAERERAEKAAADHGRNLAAAGQRLEKARKDLAAATDAEGVLLKAVEAAAATFATDPTDANEARVVELSSQHAASTRRRTAAQGLAQAAADELAAVQRAADLAELAEARRGASRAAWLEAIGPELDRLVKLRAEIDTIAALIVQKTIAHNGRGARVVSLAAKLGQQPGDDVGPIHPTDAGIIVRRRIAAEVPPMPNAPHAAGWLT